MITLRKTAESGGRPLDEFNRRDFVVKLTQGYADELDILCREAFPVLAGFIRQLGGKELTYQDAEDITVETLVAASQGIYRYDPTLSKLTTWLFQIAINKTRDHLKARSRKQRTPPGQEDEEKPSQEDEDEPEVPRKGKAKKEKSKPKKNKKYEPVIPQIRKQFEHLSEEERAAKLSQAFRSLDKESRDILWKSWSGKSDEAIADSLGITVNNYRVKRTRALLNLLAESKKITAS